jgi:hypothetical protein
MKLLRIARLSLVAIVTAANSDLHADVIAEPELLASIA